MKLRGHRSILYTLLYHMDLMRVSYYGIIYRSVDSKDRSISNLLIKSSKFTVFTKAIIYSITEQQTLDTLVR